MVFYCRCFSSLEMMYETRTKTKSTTFYTAGSNFNLSRTKRSKKPNNLRAFSFAELSVATGNFCMSSKIGEGGYGDVYKGQIRSFEYPFNYIMVAVKVPKRLSRSLEEWETEINVLGAFKHPNFVELIGYCDERNNKRLLVYKYMVQRSVRDHLHDQSETPLSWNARIKIAQDAARGLTYLHEGMSFPVILRDFKPSNILLDDKWDAKLADFGLAKFSDLGSPPQEEHTSTSFAGTMAYAAPECKLRLEYTTKSDVWSYGVFIYELITGRRPLDKSRQRPYKFNVLEWTSPYPEGIIDPRHEVDPRLEGNYPLQTPQKLLLIANKCLCKDPDSRPKMSKVLEMINQLVRVPSQATVPDKKTSNGSKKDFISILRRLASFFSCFIKKGEV